MIPTNPNIANTALAVSDMSEQKVWEHRLEEIPGISRIPENDFTRLRQLLASCEDPDSYLTSPVYYSFTGRRGLWVYEKDKAFVLACWHPNVSGQVLIFPQLIKSETDLVADLLSVIPEPTSGVRIARVKSADAAEHKNLNFDNRHISLERREEDVLDWKYPAHILSTDDVAALSGHKFMSIRNRIRQLKNYSVDVMPFDAISHSRALENLLHRWANYNAANREEYEQLYAPYETLFSQSIDKPPGLSGLMTFVDGQLQAVSLWDVSNVKEKTANIYVNFCNTDFRGLSEYSMVATCKSLLDQSVHYVNLGGSETASLNFFKKKFDPALSIDLCSVEAKIVDDCRYTAQRTIDPLKRRKLVFGSVQNV
jgi:hypothetical protein